MTYSVYPENDFEIELPNGWTASVHGSMEATYSEDSLGVSFEGFDGFEYDIGLVTDENGDEVPESMLTDDIKKIIEGDVLYDLERMADRMRPALPMDLYIGSDE